MFFTSKKSKTSLKRCHLKVSNPHHSETHIHMFVYGFSTEHTHFYFCISFASFSDSTENPLSILTLAPNKLSLHHTNTRGKQGEERSLCLLPLPLFHLSFLPCSPCSLPHSTRASLFVRRLSFHVLFKLNAILSPLTATCM